MKNLVCATGALLLMLTGSMALADECPALSETLLLKIQEMPNADPNTLVTAQIMHDEGMAMHESGDNDGCVAKLNAAIELLATAE